MTSGVKWTFRILFLLTIVYHFWSLVTSGLDAFTPLIFKSLTATIIGSAINYLIQIGLPLIFLYIGFIKGDIKESGKNKKEQKITSSYPKIRIS